MRELRCDSGILHAVLTDEGLIEVKCRSNRCGKEKGVVVIHSFNPTSGDLVDTKRFAEPQEDTSNGTRRQGTSVRSQGRQADASRS